MEKSIDEILERYGKVRTLSPGEVLCRQGSVSDGVYYLKSGRLGVYREEGDDTYLLSIVGPGEMVGELGVTAGYALGNGYGLQVSYGQTLKSNTDGLKDDLFRIKLSKSF